MPIGCPVANQSLVIDPAGECSVVALLPQVSGVDEVAYDPATGRCFLAARDNPGVPVFGIVGALFGTPCHLSRPALMMRHG